MHRGQHNYDKPKKILLFSIFAINFRAICTFVRNRDVRKCRKKYHSQLKKTIRISLLDILLLPPPPPITSVKIPGLQGEFMYIFTV